MWVVVLAGGGGTRLWPLSREEFPKQFLHFGDGESLLQKTVARFLTAPFVEEIAISTQKRYLPLVQQQIAKIDPEGRCKIILEPSRRNTAAAIAFAARHLQEQMGAPQDAVMLVLPSDHLIEPPAVFLRAVSDVEAYLQEHEAIVTFGIRPTRPETGFGYIQLGAPVESHLFRVKQFVEKPDVLCAAEYLRRGDTYWNAGIFAMPLKTLWREFEQHAPAYLGREFEQLPNVSFDYAVMEKSSRALVAPLAISWSDVGSWDSVYDTLPKDAQSNVKVGDVIDINTKNSLIFGGRRLISTIGLEDLMIVETEDATLIAKKGESQRVKALLEELRKRQPRDVKRLYMNESAEVELVMLEPGQRRARDNETWVPLSEGIVIEETEVVNRGELRGEVLCIRKRRT